MALPLLHLQGTAYEQGLQHGKELKTQVLHNLAVYFDRFKEEVSLEKEEVLTRAKQYAPALKKHNADYFASMQGLADGSGIHLDEVITLNVRYEILYYEFGVGEAERKQSGIDGCTSFAVMPERMEHKHLMLGQSWDWIPQVKGALLHTKDASGFETLSFTEAGIVGGKIGLNSAGVGLGINGLSSMKDDWLNLAKPFHMSCYEILRQSSFEAAKSVILDNERPGSANFLIGQSPHHIVNIESAPREAFLTVCEAGTVTHANHFEDKTMLEQEGLEEPFLANSCKRQERMRELLDSKEQFTTNELLEFLKDHQNYPNSICRHEDSAVGSEEHYISVTSVLMDLDARTMWVSDGPPCEAGFAKLAMSNVLKVKTHCS